MAIDHKFSNTGAVSILELFQTNIRFIVPKFQRNYSWNKEKVDVLWSDILENFMLYKNNPSNNFDSQYLLGPVVLVRGKNQSEYQVIDGQQRLSTLTMLFCAARDIILELFKSHDDTVQPTGIDKIHNLIENTHMGKHTNWKLVLNDTDKNLFEEIQMYEEGEIPQIDRIKKLQPHTKSEKYLRGNYIFLHDRLIRLLTTNSDSDIKFEGIPEVERQALQVDNIGMLNYFLDYIQQFNYVVKIMVADDNTAFQIFETLNERGQSLSKSNLIKNHVLNQISKDNQSEDEQHGLSDKWNFVFDSIIMEGQPDDDFLMESLRSRHPKDKDIKYKISTKNLYKIIKKQIKDERTCKQYIKDIEEDANFLIQLNYPDSYKDKDVKDDIRALKILNARFIRTPILAAYRKWGMNSDHKKLVSFLVKFFFKFRTIRKSHPVEVEEITLDTTQMILDGKSVSEIIIKLKGHDDHGNFKHQFSRFMKEPNKDVSKYILQQITHYMGDADSDVRPIDGLILEHILPQKYEECWKEKEFFEDEDKDEPMNEYVSRLGNMTLLKNEDNVGAANKSFDEKLKIYEESRLRINIETVCTYDQWTTKIIKEREDKFADYADKIWNLEAV